jgi:RNA polymerase sigma factor (sigma-70 family)
MESDDLSTDAATDTGSPAEPASFEAAWREVAPAVFAWASLRVRAPLRARVDPDDLLQEVAARAWAQFDRWDPARGVFRGWVFGIANNVLREALRQVASDRGRRGSALLSTDGWAQLPDTATAMSRAVLRDERLSNLLAHLEALPEEDRRLLIFRGLEGLPHDEVAEVLQLGPEAVAKRWQRLRARLRELSAWAELVAD